MADKIIKYSFYLLFFLVPLILTPWNYELFEFNKMLVVYALTAIITAAWLTKMVLAKKIIFQRSFWDLPLIIFLTSQLISYLFSVDKHTSFWGYYSRFNGGLLSIICYLLLYWAFVSNLSHLQGVHSATSEVARQRPRLLRGVLIAILSSATLVAAYGILEHLGIDARYWVQDVRNRVFSTIGQPNWLAAYLVALIPLTWAFALNSKIKNQKSKFTVYHLLFTIYYLCFLFTRSRSGLLGFGIALITFGGLSFLSAKRSSRVHTLKALFVFSFLFLFLSLWLGRNWIPGFDKIKFLNSKPATRNSQLATEKPSEPLLISESSDIRKIVWKGAIDIWKHYPILGTGPETFAYSYYWYRPREHNDVSEWDFLYNKAHNEYLNYAATTGSIGLISYLILIGSFVLWSVKKIVNSLSRYLAIAFLSGWLSIIVTNSFGFSVVPVQLLFFLFPAFAVTTYNLGLTTKDKGQNKTLAKLVWWQPVLIISFVLCSMFFVLRLAQYWYADTRYAKAEKLNKAGQYDTAFNLLQSAIKLRSFEPVYHDELALAAADLTILAQKQENATLAGQLAVLAVTESDKAIKTSPYNLNFWKTRTKVFYKLGEIEPRFNQKALEALLRATELAPTEPKIKYNLGLIYAALDQIESAITTLKEAADLKPNYEDPHYALALFYEQKGEKQLARQELELILKTINPVSQKAKDELEKLK